MTLEERRLQNAVQTAIDQRRDAQASLDAYRSQRYSPNSMVRVRTQGVEVIGFVLSIGDGTLQLKNHITQTNPFWHAPLSSIIEIDMLTATDADNER